MRRLAPLAIALLAVLLVGSGCSTSAPGRGSGKVVAPVGTVPATGVKAQAAPTVPAQYKNGDATAGKQVFLSAGCIGCHTLADANAKGQVGPNLDQAKPPLALVVTRVTKGQGAMPPFKGQLSDKQIADVAAYVVKATGGDAAG